MKILATPLVPLVFLASSILFSAHAQSPSAPQAPAASAAPQAPAGAIAPQAPAAAEPPASIVPGTPDAPGSPESPDVSARSAGVRIVRLSQVKGDVRLDRKTGSGAEVAFNNLPIAQGERLETHQGLAEIEFEDNSTVRLAPDTVVEFPRLERNSAGLTGTTVVLLRGTLYASIEKARTVDFVVRSGFDTITLKPNSHIRLETGSPQARLTVFNGDADLANASGLTAVGKKKSVLFDPSTQVAPTFASLEEPAQFDAWDKQLMDYHKLRSLPAGFGSSSFLYGVNDLNYYGSFTNVGGCGSMWRPYFTSAGWDPYGNGVWAWYPGVGYSWVSPYPWGWTPFHYGSWDYCAGGGGWGWRPGGVWTGLGNHPRPLSPLNPGRLGAPEHHPTPRPPRPPSPGRPTLVAVSTQHLTSSQLTSAGTFVFAKDSAGLGVPRSALGHLNHISNNVAAHGSFTKEVSTTNMIAPSAGASSWNRGGSGPRGERNQPGTRGGNDPHSNTALNHGNNPGANGDHGDRGDRGNRTSSGQPGGFQPGGSRPGGDAGSHSQGAANSSPHSGGGGGWSGGGGGGNHTGGGGGGGWSGGGGGGGGHPMGGGAPAPSAPAPSAPAPSAPAPSGGGAHR